MNPRKIHYFFKIIRDLEDKIYNYPVSLKKYYSNRITLISNMYSPGYSSEFIPELTKYLNPPATNTKELTTIKEGELPSLFPREIMKIIINFALCDIKNYTTLSMVSRAFYQLCCSRKEELKITFSKPFITCSEGTLGFTVTEYSLLPNRKMHGTYKYSINNRVGEKMVIHEGCFDNGRKVGEFITHHIITKDDNHLYYDSIAEKEYYDSSGYLRYYYPNEKQKIKITYEPEFRIDYIMGNGYIATFIPDKNLICVKKKSVLLGVYEVSENFTEYRSDGSIRRSGKILDRKNYQINNHDSKGNVVKVRIFDNFGRHY